MWTLLAAAGAAAAPLVPLTNPGSWISTDDYPAIARRDELQGEVAFRLTVNPNGSVRSCSILPGDAPKLLKAATCPLLMRRARFKPFRGKRARYFQSRVRWTLASEPTRQPLAMTADGGHYALSFTANGEPTSCTFDSFGTPVQMAEVACAKKPTRATFAKEFNLDLDGVSRVDFIAVQRPVSVPEPAIKGIPQNAVPNVIFRQRFTVSQMGEISNCLVEVNLVSTDASVDLCAKGGSTFDDIGYAPTSEPVTIIRTVTVYTVKDGKTGE